MNVLFIGNSFTARNDVPGLIGRMAASRGRELRHDLVSAGGASLRAHWNKGVAAELIRSKGYDHVVLQEQSTLPVKNARRMHENIRLFDEIIRGSRATTALYLTWARRNAPESQQAITTAYITIAEELGATVVPVGVAWESLLREPEPPVLHDRDMSHPSPAGSYLAACVFFAVLFEASPVGIPIAPAGVPDDVAIRLQETAWATVRSGRSARG